jgi:glycosyl transferase, family 25
MDQIPVFVIHVRGAKHREEHMNDELGKKGLAFEFMLNGNKEDLDSQILDKYFSGQMHNVNAIASCGLKHLLVYETMVSRNLEHVLIFEDDIILQKNFNQVFSDSIKEIHERGLKNILVSYENSNHFYVSKDEVIANQILYKKDMGRCAGAYLVDIECVHTILEEIKHTKCDLPIDWFHNKLAKEGKINIYWSFPHIAEQGSHNGKMGSLIDNKKKGFFRRIVYYLQKHFRTKNNLS